LTSTITRIWVSFAPRPDGPAHQCVERHRPNSTWVLKFFLSHDAVPQRGGHLPGHDHTDAGTHTSHTVSVPAGFSASLGCVQVTPEELVRASFEFLLEREPATSILHTFGLDVISQYFPYYPARIRDRLGSSDPGTPRDQAPGASTSLWGRGAGRARPS
jgi:hypothetical protein